MHILTVDYAYHPFSQKLQGKVFKRLNVAKYVVIFELTSASPFFYLGTKYMYNTET